MPLPAVLAGFAASHPELWGIIQSLGIRGATALIGQGVGKLIGSPEEARMKQSLEALSRLQPQYLQLLEKQMAGQPTAASEAIRGQVAQTSRAGQQSLATSARRQGQGGSEVARANQSRFLAAMAQMEGQQLGQAQMGAQQQVGQLTGQAQQMQAGLAAQEGQELQQLMGYIMKGVFDDEIRRLIEKIYDASSDIPTAALPPMSTADTAPTAEGEPTFTGGVQQASSMAGAAQYGPPAPADYRPPTASDKTPQITTHPGSQWRIKGMQPPPVPPVRQQIATAGPLPAYGSIAKPLREKAAMPKRIETPEYEFRTPPKTPEYGYYPPDVTTPARQQLEQPTFAEASLGGDISEVAQTQAASDIPQPAQERIGQLQTSYYNDVDWYKFSLERLQREYGLTDEQLRESVRLAQEMYWQDRGPMRREVR